MSPEESAVKRQQRVRKRDSMSPEESAVKRQQRVRKRDSMTPEQRAEESAVKRQQRVRKRDSMTPEQRAEESAVKRQQRVRRASSQGIEDASRSFAAAVREGPDYVCTCCHRLMYRKTVLEFKATKYSKLSENFIQTVFPREVIYTSAQQKVWICRTCDNTLKRGRMPAQAKANNLILEDVTPELSDLNLMEIRLISLRIPFMKMVALPCGKQ